MRLVSFEGGFGRVEGDDVVPMGPDLVAYLATGEVDRCAGRAARVRAAARRRSRVPAR